MGDSGIAAVADIRVALGFKLVYRKLGQAGDGRAVFDDDGDQRTGRGLVAFDQPVRVGMGDFGLDRVVPRAAGAPEIVAGNGGRLDVA